MKTALITGVAGQDGSYLAELLIEKGYNVYGLILKGEDLGKVNHIKDKIHLIEGDVTDIRSIEEALKTSKPSEVYNLAAYPSNYIKWWGHPIETANVTGVGVLKVLETIRKFDKNIKFLQASTSEIFGNVNESPQNENTEFRPRNPYGVAKLFAHLVTQIYNKRYGMFACSTICYNHESPRGRSEFVTGKIADTVAKISLGMENELRLGNLNAKRDWGFAGDFVRAMWLILQQKKPDDFVIATGKTHSVKDFVEVAFKTVGLDWEKYVKVDESLVRPTEKFELCGDISKAKKILGWEPKVEFEDLVKMMVEDAVKKHKRINP
jgi:GDPmannose 4,6-dehydratase